MTAMPARMTLATCRCRGARLALGRVLRQGPEVGGFCAGAAPTKARLHGLEVTRASASQASQARAEGTPRLLDEFGLISQASSLLQRSRRPEEAGPLRDAALPDVAAWQALSDRAVNVLMLTATRGVLAWFLDAVAQADLHPSERAHLAFPRLFRQEVCATMESVTNLSDDELCLVWSALERLTLLDKQTSLLLFRAATKRPDGGGPQRCHKFSLQNWVRVAVGLRGFQRHHPLHMEFVESVALRLLVQNAPQLLKQGLQMEALDAVSRMTAFSSRQIHRVTATMHAQLPSMNAAELVIVPRLCARANLQDETLFAAFVERLAKVFHTLTLRELVSMWRNVFRWHVGMPGSRRSAGSAIAEAITASEMLGFPPRATLRILRSLGRIDAETLRDRGPHDIQLLQREGLALAHLLATSLRVLPKTFSSLDASELLIATNALGQVARAWSWLSDDGSHDNSAWSPEPLQEMRHCAESLSEAVSSQLYLITLQALEENHVPSECSQYTDRDLAVLCLANARVARRSFPAGSVPAVAFELCKRLCDAASKTFEIDVGSASLQATSMLVSQVARSPALHAGSREHVVPNVVLATAALDCMIAWAPAMAGQVEMHKAVASAAILGGQLVRLRPLESQSECNDNTAIKLELRTLTSQLCAALPLLVSSTMQAQGDNGDSARSAELFESWHLDGALHAATVFEALTDATLYRSGSTKPFDILQREVDAVIVELCSRRATITESSARFWLARLCEPKLLAHGVSVPHRLCTRLLTLEDGEPALDTAVGSTLRDMAFLLNQ